MGGELRCLGVQEGEEVVVVVVVVGMILSAMSVASLATSHGNVVCV